MAAPRRILTVCTANACRSPVAERLLQRELAAAGLDVEVSSAGVQGGGYAVPAPTAQAADLVGIDLIDHQSRLLTADLVRDDGADLIVCMTREHLRAVVGFDPDAFGRTFTLRELVRRTNELAEPPADWDSWLAACHRGRTAGELTVADPADDLPDPIGRPLSDHILMVQEVVGAARLLASHAPLT